MDKPKPYAIPKWLVYDAYERVKANHGAAGVDGERLARLRSISRTTSTKSGTACRPGAISRRR